MIKLRRLIAIILLVFSSFPLAAEISVGGKIVDANAEPLAKARIDLMPMPSAYELARIRLTATKPEPVASVASDGGGLFEASAPDPGFWILRIEKPGFAPQELPLTPLLDSAELAPLELAAGHEITVRVVGADGEPVAARVRAALRDPENVPIPFRRLAAGFAVDHLVAIGPGDEVRWALGDGDWTVEAHVDGHPPLRQQVKSKTDRRIELRARPGVERRIEVVDARGRPVAGAVVSIEDGLLPLSETDAKGRATLIVDDGGAVSLEVLGPEGRHGSHKLAPLDARRSALETEVVELAEPVTVRGRVIDEDTRRPVAGALVWSGFVTGRADDAGGYVLSAPADELKAVAAAAVGYSQGVGMFGDPRGSRLPGEGKIDGPTISLAAAAAVRGLVVDADGEPLRSVEITVEPRLNRARRNLSFRPPSVGSGSSRTSEQGRFRIPGLTLASGYVLRFVKDGFAPAKLEIDDLATFEERESLRIVMRSGRRGVGWVVDEQDAPVAGAEVRIKEAAATSSRRRMILEHGDSQGRPDAVADPEGRFAIDDLAPGRYDLEAAASGFAAATVPGIEVPEGSGELDLGTLVLIPGAAIEGTVVDDRGLPIAGAAVRAVPQSRMPSAFVRRMSATGKSPDAVSDVDGRFRLPDQVPGARVDLSVEKEGFVAVSLSGVEAPNAEPLEIVLRPTSSVLGRVIDSDGQPIVGAAVDVRPERGRGSGMGSPSWNQQFTSGDDGTFEITGVEPGRATVAASAAGYRRQELAGLEVPADEPLRDVEIVLTPGAIVRGTVTEADGSPVVGVFVAVTDLDSTGLGGDGTVTDADGKFLISGTAEGRRKVLAMDRASRRASKNVEIELGTNEVDLVFEGGVEVSGQVVDAGGAGVAGARVALRQSRTGSVPRFGRQETLSTVDGSFSVADVQPGTYGVSASKEGFAPAELDEPLEVGAHPVGGLQLRLPAGTTLTGSVLGLEYDELARVQIRAFVSGSGVAKPDFEGRYRIPNLPAGELTVQAEIPGSGRQVREKTTIPAGASEAVLDLEFGSGFTLTGIVFHGERPLGGAMLRMSGVDVSHSGNTTVSQDGKFRVEGLPAGSYRLLISDWQGGISHDEEIEITADADVRIEISTGRIAGRVRDAVDFAPIEAATVSATRVDADGSTRGASRPTFARSDARGYFSLGEVNEGVWKVTATKSGYGPAEQTVEVRTGSAVEDVDLAMSATEGLTFEIVMASGRVPAAVRAAFLDGSGRQVASGIFETSGGEVVITTVPAGAWEMVLVADDSAVLQLPVTAPGDLGRLVAAPGGGLSITVPELGAEAASATIRLTGPDGRSHRFFDRRGQVSSELTLYGGLARAANLAPGAWTVSVVTADGRSWSATATVVAGVETAVSVP